MKEFKPVAGLRIVSNLVSWKDCLFQGHKVVVCEAPASLHSLVPWWLSFKNTLDLGERKTPGGLCPFYSLYPQYLA